MKTKIMADFQICISVPLILIDVKFHVRNACGISIDSFGKKEDHSSFL